MAWIITIPFQLTFWLLKMVVEKAITLAMFLGMGFVMWQGAMWWLTGEAPSWLPEWWPQWAYLA